MTILLVFLLAALTFVTIQPVDRASTAASSAASPTVIKIGVVTDLSTAFAYYGEQEVAGLTLGLAYAVGVTNVTQAIQQTSYGYTVTGGGYQFQIYVADGESDPTLSTEAAVQLVTQDGVQILQGSPDSDSAIAVAAVAAQYQVIFMAAPAADYDITAQNFNVYTFRLASNSYQDALADGPYAVQNIGKSFAIIAPDYSWGFEEVAEWSAVVQSAGGKIVTVQYPPEGATDFTPYIDHILASNATVVLPIWVGPGAVTLFQQLNSLGVYKQMSVTTGVPDMTSFNFELVGNIPAFTGMTKYAFNLPNNTVNTWLIKNYVTLFKENRLPEQTATYGSYFFPLPDIFMPDSFATGQAIVAALAMTGGNPAAPGMIQALQGMYLNTPKGPMYIRPQDHQALQDMYIVKVAYTNTTMSEYYTGPSQFPSDNVFAGSASVSINVFKTGFWGAQLIETLDETQTAPPIYAGTGSAARPAVSFTTTCSSSTPVLDKTTTCKATVQQSGSKAATGTVTWSVPTLAGIGSGKFSKASCTLSKGACTVKFTPTTAGPVIVVASYGGASGYPAAAAGYSMLVTGATSKTAVSCKPTSAVAGSSTVITCNAKVTGYLPTGQVTWSQSGTGSVSLSSAACTLTSSTNPNQATCSMTMTGTTAGKVTLQATYSGDSNNLASTKTTKLTVKS
ncbi:MAG: ABC transporter substrate-binding protein [Nitrososphaerales archaeon]